MVLTTEAIEKAKPGINASGRVTVKPYKMGDSGGLFLLVNPKGGKWWRLKYRYDGKEKQLSLGAYPEIPLAEAREKRDVFRAMLADGTDPSAHVKMERAAQQAEKARQLAATRFMLDNKGALSFRLGNRCLVLTPAETSELRAFLDATRDLIPKVMTCP